MEVLPDGDDPTGFDEYYTYDGLDRLSQAKRGTLSGGSITNNVHGEAWGLSPTGNWNDYQIDHDGNYTDASDLDQGRTHNLVNETTGITEQSNPQQSQWADPTYSARGNSPSRVFDMTSVR